MTLSETLVRTGLRVGARVAPDTTARVMAEKFFTVGQRVRVWPQDEPVMAAARRETVVLNARPGGTTDVVTYTWGDGSRTVLLAHGWQSRTSRFGAIITRLVDDGATVVGFDAPGNGETDGTTSSLLDHLDLISLLAEKQGELDAIIGHSFGALAARIAVEEGVPARRVVAIAGPNTFDFLADTAAVRAGLPPRLLPPMIDRAMQRVLPGTTGAEAAERFHVLRPTSVPLLIVHDDADPEVPLVEAEEHAAAAGEGAHLLVTHGHGHNRVLVAQETVDAVAKFCADSAPQRLT
ncbi:Pimeloyl-ACP methyl ester carboxylesterase [Paraoerskovia marina]|uniref:Pimeloyl-ACP methyl ester carboxylesterase n=1 Tax=Paraoerskovia marina TaxID=545619 RepID=A0A1H1PHN3_9CELL|nr:alpha/beta fold hydrolase [Paraoerskovia marina]SDS10778.1 Pimeloyl-ACP methyl ester carboxylesterase [Paraoerskovia marina]